MMVVLEMKDEKYKSIALCIALITFFAYYQIAIAGKEISDINMITIILIALLADPLNMWPYKWERKSLKKCCAYWFTFLVILVNWFVEPLFYDYFDQIYVGLAFLVGDILYSLCLAVFVEKQCHNEKDKPDCNI